MRWSPAALGAQLALLIFVAPVCLGLLGVLLPALGYFPSLGSSSFSMHPFWDFLALPGLRNALFLSLSTGLIATALSLCGAVCLLLLFWGRGQGRWLLRFIGPILAIPPTAIAAGLMLLLVMCVDKSIVGLIELPLTENCFCKMNNSCISFNVR